MTDRYTNDPTRNVSAKTSHDPTTTQGGGAPPSTVQSHPNNLINYSIP